MSTHTRHVLKRTHARTRESAGDAHKNTRKRARTYACTVATCSYAQLFTHIEGKKNQNGGDPNNSNAICTRMADLNNCDELYQRFSRKMTTLFLDNSQKILGTFLEDAVHSSGVCLDPSDYNPLIRYIRFSVY